MKKIFKKVKLKNLIFTILVLITGVVIGGIVGVTATTNKLEAKYVMYTKDGKTMTVQDAIKDLYVLAENSSKCPKGYICEQSKLVTENKPTGTLGVAYYNPVEGKVCTESQYNIDLESYKTTNSVTTPTGQKDGCMKWYVFKEYDTSYTMILDHNTTATVKWNSDNVNTSKKEIQTELNNLVNVTKWKVTPRLIHAQEIANITGNTSWTSGGSGFYFNGNSSSSQTTGSNIYYWLFDYTRTCTGYGCKVADSSTRGYWTDTAYADVSTRVWIVYNNGGLFTNYAGTSDHGLRPVITVQKSNF